MLSMGNTQGPITLRNIHYFIRKNTRYFELNKVSQCYLLIFERLSFADEYVSRCKLLALFLRIWIVSYANLCSKRIQSAYSTIVSFTLLSVAFSNKRIRDFSICRIDHVFSCSTHHCFVLCQRLRSITTLFKEIMTQYQFPLPQTRQPIGIKLSAMCCFCEQTFKSRWGVWPLLKNKLQILPPKHVNMRDAKKA